MSNISSHDKAILNRIFNPNLPYGDVVEEEKPQEDEEIQTPAILEAKQLELQGVQAAESGDIQQALDIFSQAIQVLPSRASGYNNRAQALRLKGDVQGALEDLNKAIELSQGRGNAACQAYTQRGLIYKLEGMLYMYLAYTQRGLIHKLEGKLYLAYTQRGLIYKLEGDEDKALEDFKCAANLGGQFAKQQVVAMNPYAALCNQMLCEMVKKVKSGEM
ncbi:hypothetical protein FSP39_009949 [Pinctada imbricata]|uniref:Tetratricopeptide repeat protein 36 n=1 Tax=Pinctada imbricata TaxID=66713 RepID=A0AA88YPH6_PINIB|nr:hypothetical protein FSP39_009949 [Pinctada imbricata]